MKGKGTAISLVLKQVEREYSTTRQKPQLCPRQQQKRGTVGKGKVCLCFYLQVVPEPRASQSEPLSLLIFHAKRAQCLPGVFSVSPSGKHQSHPRKTSVNHTTAPAGLELHVEIGVSLLFCPHVAIPLVLDVKTSRKCLLKPSL